MADENAVAGEHVHRLVAWVEAHYTGILEALDAKAERCEAHAADESLPWPLRFTASTGAKDWRDAANELRKIFESWPVES